MGVTVLPKVAMQPEVLQPDTLYLWALPFGQTKVVWLNDDGDGLAEYDDEWFFKDNLLGTLYGPVLLDF